MNIGVVGLGLIGGSFAKAYKRVGCRIYGSDINNLTFEFAVLSEVVDQKLTNEKIHECEVIFLAVSPKQAVKWMEDHKDYLTENNLVIDLCGTKRLVCKYGFKLAKENGFHFAGGHPMAGYHHGGFKYSKETLFDDALFVLVPNKQDDLWRIKYMKNLIMLAGFKGVVCTSKEKHDKVIAFTSQMEHVVSNAFIKSDTALELGTKISAGSYKDFTRVAYLDPDMWTELFMENRDNLKKEIDVLCKELEQYSKALEEKDEKELRRLLAEGRDRKTEVDNKWN